MGVMGITIPRENRFSFEWRQRNATDPRTRSLPLSDNIGHSMQTPGRSIPMIYDLSPDGLREYVAMNQALARRAQAEGNSELAEEFEEIAREANGHLNRCLN